MSLCGLWYVPVSIWRSNMLDWMDLMTFCLTKFKLRWLIDNTDDKRWCMHLRLVSSCSRVHKLVSQFPTGYVWSLAFAIMTGVYHTQQICNSKCLIHDQQHWRLYTWNMIGTSYKRSDPIIIGEVHCWREINKWLFMRWDVNHKQWCVCACVKCLCNLVCLKGHLEFVWLIGLSSLLASSSVFLSAEATRLIIHLYLSPRLLFSLPLSQQTCTTYPRSPVLVFSLHWLVAM